jgi:hypothetical protein
MLPLTVPEARAILAADEALDRTFKEREASGQTLGLAEGAAWMKIVESANARVAGFEGRRSAVAAKTAAPTPYPGGNEPDFQTLFMEAVTNQRVESRTGYTIKRLTAEDAAHVAELLRVSIDDKHYLAWHPKLREIREKMIERMGDTRDQERAP